MLEHSNHTLLVSPSSVTPSSSGMSRSGSQARGRLVRSRRFLALLISAGMLGFIFCTREGSTAHGDASARTDQFYEAFRARPPLPKTQGVGTHNIDTERKNPDIAELVNDAPAWFLSGPEETLPACEKIFLYTMLPPWGFGSELMLHVRLGVSPQLANLLTRVAHST